MSVLDGIAYTPENKQIRDQCYVLFLEIEAFVNEHVRDSRSRRTFFVEFENCYTWFAKAVKDHQILATARANRDANPELKKTYKKMPVKRRSASDAVVIERKKRI